MSTHPALGVMTADEEDRANVALNFLNGYIPMAWNHFLYCRENAAPQSVVARARADRDLVLVLDAALFLESAADHYTTLINVFVHGPIPRYALYTVVRGALEADAWACWLLDTSIDDPERVGRALTLRASNLFEVRRMGLHPVGASPTEHYSKRMKRVIEAAERWHLTPKSHKDGRIAFVPMPRITALIRSLLPEQSEKSKDLTVGEHTYAELSARAHGTQWALISKATPVNRADDYQTMAYVEVDVLELIRLLGIAVNLHDEAVRRMAILSSKSESDWIARRGPIPW
jgi:hypothetical protein